MMPSCWITSIEFRNYKALEYFSVRLDRLNIMVGVNNAGKSTIIGALRILAVGLRKCQTQAPTNVRTQNGIRYGYHLNQDSVPVSLENVHSELSEADTTVTFRLSNGSRLALLFPSEGGCILYGEHEGRPTRTAAAFKAAYPITIAVVPVLGPVEHDEQLVNAETVQRNVATHRASRNFRSYWYHNPEGFSDFASLIQRTWPNMDVTLPEIVSGYPPRVVMFCKENRCDRELYWSGFGFQVWCQLLTHVSRAKSANMLVVDEPEIYLHADLQRQIIALLRDLGPNVILATHSSEIVAEAEPGEIVLIDKNRRSGHRLMSSADSQKALDQLGSAHNMTLTQLAKTRRVLFVEGVTDFKLLRRFAKKLALPELAAGLGITSVDVKGFSRWEDVKVFSAGLEGVLGAKLLLGAIFDRDYRPFDQARSVQDDLGKHVSLAHVHYRKELENYLLVPVALQRAIDTELKSKSTPESVKIGELLETVTEGFRNNVCSQLLKANKDWIGKGHKDETTVTQEFLNWFEGVWAVVEQRLPLVPGKEVLRCLRTTLQSQYGINLTDARIVDAMPRDDIPKDLAEFIQKLEVFRVSPPPTLR